MNINLSELDLQDVGSWPNAMRYTVAAIVGIFALFVGYFLHIQGMQDELAGVQGQESTLLRQLQSQQRKVINLPGFQKYLKNMSQEFRDVLTQLPSKPEEEALIDEITRLGNANQLVFKSFNPGKRKAFEFHAELPLDFSVQGTYHQLGQFVNGVASLNRIVSLHDIQLTPESDGNGFLTMTATARLYWYLQDPKKKKKKNK